MENKEINVNLLEKLEKDKTEKDNLSSSSTALTEQINLFFEKLRNYIFTLKVKETSSILLSFFNWLKTKEKYNKKKYKTRDIVEVDLGIGYGFEMSYRHPCIVLKDEAGFCLIVPCSTGKYGKNNKFILDATPKDGFKQNTGILLDSVRTISKTRISNTLGEISVDILEQINKKMIEFYFPTFNYKYNKLISKEQNQLE